MRAIALLVILYLSCGVAYGQELPVVNSIEIQGLKRIEQGAVRSKISHKIGEPLSQKKTNEDIKSIFKMGYFEDVKVDIESFEGGVKLVYVVKEKPTIIRLEFQGNEEFDDAKLKEQITVTPGSIADTVLIQDNAAQIRAFYKEKGYWLSNVVPVLNRISEDEITLTFQIDEGSKIKIRDIVIEGNNRISSKKIRKAMETKEWWLFSFIKSSGYYKDDRMQMDIEKIKNLYYDKGYIQVLVSEPEIRIDTEEKKGMTITIKISEGNQFSISAVTFTGNTVFDNKTVQNRITLQPGDIFSKSRLGKDIGAISALYSDNGYAMISVLPDLAPDIKDNTVRVDLKISEGDKYHIGRIEISGNTKTRDKVIRREIRLDEGETFSGYKLRRSYERINNLNFFDAVDLAPKPRYEEKVVDLEVKVKERATGFFSVGGGYSTVDKFIATADITQGNLFGRGQYIKVKGELGGRSTLYEVAFKDPWFLDRPLSFSAGLYKTSREYPLYDKDAFGGYIGLGKNISEYWKTGITYRYEEATIEDIDDDASLIIKDQEGTNTTSSVTLTASRDSRDNFIDPSRGSRNALSFTFAGIGGTNAFVKGTVDSGWYFPIGRTSFMIRGRFGYARGIFDEELPLYERFYVGGIYTVRGLDWGDAGPIDAASGDPIGGTEQLIFNVEYIFPILPDLKLKGVVFFDAGNSYNEFGDCDETKVINCDDFPELRYTTGGGIRWISPMGPIRIEYGYNIDKRPDESSSKFEFAFGSFF